MPGRKLEKRLWMDLGRRADKMGVTTPLYIHDWVADGGTITKLAEELKCSRAFLSRILNADPDCREALNAARKEQAELMAEDSMALVDALADREDLTTQDVALAKERVSVRKWLSALNAPERFAQKQQNLTVNIGELHLSALKKAVPALSSAEVVEGRAVELPDE